MTDFDYPIPSTAPLIKIEDTPSPPPRCESVPPTQPDVVSVPPPSTATLSASPPSVVDQDPEGYLKRCSGYNKRTGKRCEKVIGKGTYNSRNGINYNSLYLPTCHSHRDQQSFAGRCQYIDRAHGRRCGRLFRWTKPYFELCEKHVGHPDTPCYILKLPLELRLEIFRYLMPHGPIGSSTSHAHQPRSTYASYIVGAQQASLPPIITTARLTSQYQHSFPNSRGSVVSLMLVNRQFYTEAKDLLYGVTPFTIDIRRDGTFMCGRRLLEPKTDMGHSANPSPGGDGVSGKFLQTFDFSAVKNYNVEILVENKAQPPRAGPIPRPSLHMQDSWNEEVEIYDIRDYVCVAVCGILSKSRTLCRLNVHVVATDFAWSDEEALAKTICIVEPFMRLRKVLIPKLCGLYEGAAGNPFIASVPIPNNVKGGPNNLYSVPLPPKDSLRLAAGEPGFDEYKKIWEKTISQTTLPPPKPPIRTMFTELKKFYTVLAEHIGDLHRSGKNAFLHRARVAREQENVNAFREVRNELIMHWNQYLEVEETKRTQMNKRMGSMLDVDSYPSAEDESPRKRSSSPEAPGSPDYLEILNCSEEGLGMNGSNINLLQQRMRLQMVTMQMINQGLTPLHQHLPQLQFPQRQPKQQAQLQAQILAQQQAQLQSPQQLFQQALQLNHTMRQQQMQHVQRRIQEAQFNATQDNTGMQIAQLASYPETDANSPPQYNPSHNAVASSSGSSSSPSSSATLSPSNASSSSTIHPSAPLAAQQWTRPFNIYCGIGPIDQQQIVSQPPALNSPDFPTSSTNSSDTAALSPLQSHTPDYLSSSWDQAAKRKVDVIDLDNDDIQEFERKPKLWRGSVIGNSKGKAKAEYIEILDD